jgi:hypothetical protein
MMHDPQFTLNQVKDYYGKTLTSTRDLQTATYRETIPGNPHQFALDDHHLFITGKPMLVCGNSAARVQETRFCKHFRVTGDKAVHFGLFDCSPAAQAESGGGCC